jgi:hypothetical protein
MSTACSLEELLLLAQNKLRARRVRRLQNHMAVCSWCRAEWKTVSQIAALAPALQQREVPEGIQARIWSQLAESGDFRDHARTLNMRRLLLTGACAATLFIAVAVFNAPRRSVAFAQVVQAMNSVHSVSWNETRTWVNSRREVDSVERTDCVVNWQPVTFISRMPGRVTMSDEHQMVIYDGAGRKIRERRHTADQPPLREELLSMITAPATSRMAEWNVEDVGTGGQSLLRFRQERESSGITWVDTVWAEAGTLRVLRVEHNQRNADGHVYSETRDHFRYNELVPP